MWIRIQRIARPKLVVWLLWVTVKWLRLKAKSVASMATIKIGV